MHITVISLFPDMFSAVIHSSILKRAQEKGLVVIDLVDLRDYGIGPHKSVDDKPYGGGAGMVLRVDVVEIAIREAKKEHKKAKVILLDARGETFSQKKAEELSQLQDIILLCGHYEGFDERIRGYVDLEISIGDFIVTGGEIPAMLIIDSIVRLIPGVLNKEESFQNESFSKTDQGRLLEHPQYTRPETYNGKNVPEILLSGDHKKIETLRLENSLKITKENRPDLLK